MKKKHFTTLGLIMMYTFILNSCVKKSYENPPSLASYDPKLPVNLKIRDLVSPYWGTSGGFRTLGDSTIYGIVIADDRSGNFYKQIVIQDSTGGINIAVDNTNIYTTYPIGRKVYIKLNGLSIISYKGNPELAYAISSNGSTVTGIPAVLEDSFIVPASFPNTVQPYECRLSDIIGFPSPYLNMLLKIDDMQFDSSAMNLPYAAPANITISTSRQIDGCLNGTSTGSLVLYNSGYATFFNANTPSGYGSITGVWTVYGTINQFQIRDTSDVRMSQSRCQ